MKRNLFFGFLIALAVAAFLSPFASPYPDGLDRVAEDKGFLTLAEGKKLIHAFMPDYQFPGITHQGLATSIAGIIGTLLVFAALYFLARVLSKTRTAASSLKGKEDRK
ncbi:PDGLE domain-containing protein [Desulfofundulus sp.]|uniref:PDGLE domain-containing protein n=1 Tax=Desulfofundulus sp. TaxID=2282750 RepID=UPI003C764D27